MDIKSSAKIAEVIIPFVVVFLIIWIKENKIMEQVIGLLKDINIGELIVIGMIVWFFYTRLDEKMEKLGSRLELKIDNVEQRLNAKIDNVEQKLETRIDVLSEKVEDVDRRLCRIEGSLSTQGHCLFNQTHKEKKAE